MNAPARVFEAKPAVRESVPLLIGLMGPSGSGKTYSALRLATGIQRIAGGDIWGIDTEARRMRHYADLFKFKHVQFDAPFGSMDYLAAVTQAVKAGAGVVIVDSMSHEHEGQGGMIEWHERELDRLAGDDWQKRERVKMLAWQKPKAARRSMINGLLQLNANLIFCFRAKEKLKIMPGKPPVQQGFMPIAGEELVFEMTVNCLLLPHANGAPTWRSDQVGERMMMKLPEQFKSIFADDQPLSEDIGAKLAAWAKGDQNSARLAAAEGERAAVPIPATELPPPVSDEVVDPLLDKAREKANEGAAVFDAWAKKLTAKQAARLEPHMGELTQRVAAAGP